MPSGWTPTAAATLMLETAVVSVGGEPVGVSVGGVRLEFTEEVRNPEFDGKTVDIAGQDRIIRRGVLASGRFLEHSLAMLRLIERNVAAIVIVGPPAGNRITPLKAMQVFTPGEYLTTVHVEGTLADGSTVRLRMNRATTRYALPATAHGEEGVIDLSIESRLDVDLFTTDDPPYDLQLLEPGATGDDIADLGTALGDNGSGNVLLAIYDTRRHVTVDTGDVVSLWKDARLLAGVPDLTAAGTARPAWNPATQVITTDGVDDMMSSPTPVSLFDLGVPLTMFAVAELLPGGGGTSALTIAGDSEVRAMTITRLNIVNVTSFFKPGAEVITSLVSADGVRRVMFAAQNGGTTGYAEVPNGAQQSAAITTIGTENNRLRVGALHNASGHAPAIIRAVGVLAGVYSTAQKDAIRDWAVAHHAAVLA